MSLSVNHHLWQLSQLTLSLSNAALLQLREEAKEEVQQILSDYAGESELLDVGLHGAWWKDSEHSCVHVDYAIYVNVCHVSYPKKAIKFLDVATQLREVRNKAEAFLIGEQIH